MRAELLLRTEHDCYTELLNTFSTEYAAGGRFTHQSPHNIPRLPSRAKRAALVPINRCNGPSSEESHETKSPHISSPLQTALHKRHAWCLGLHLDAGKDCTFES